MSVGKSRRARAWRQATAPPRASGVTDQPAGGTPPRAATPRLARAGAETEPRPGGRQPQREEQLPEQRSAGTGSGSGSGSGSALPRGRTQTDRPSRHPGAGGIHTDPRHVDPRGRRPNNRLVSVGSTDPPSPYATRHAYTSASSASDCAVSSYDSPATATSGTPTYHLERFALGLGVALAVSEGGLAWRLFTARTGPCSGTPFISPVTVWSVGGGSSPMIATRQTARRLPAGGIHSARYRAPRLPPAAPREQDCRSPGRHRDLRRHSGRRLRRPGRFRRPAAGAALVARRDTHRVRRAVWSARRSWPRTPGHAAAVTCRIPPNPTSTAPCRRLLRARPPSPRSTAGPPT